jgi:hypothetical protein
MSRRLKFHSPADLHQAYAGLADQSWVDSCLVDVPGLELRVHLVDGPASSRRADAWIQGQRWWQAAVRD